MQYLHDDMNELFQKASEEIRLNPMSDDWERIQGRLVTGTSVQTISESVVTRLKNRRSMLAAFIIFALTGTTTLFVINGNEKKLRSHQKETTIPFIQSAIKYLRENDKNITKVRTGYRVNTLKPMDLKLSNVQLVPRKQKPIENKLAGLNAEKINAYEMGILSSTGEDYLNHQGSVLINDNVKKTHRVSKSSVFYPGIVVGPQFTQAYQQGFSEAGLSAGLVVGIHLSNRLAIETGLMFSKKGYHIAGQYFDKSKITSSMPAGMNLTEVKSKINVLEIPVRLKYEFIKTKQASIYATGGVNTFIITRESNDYQGTLNGNTEKLNGLYNTHRNYIASAVCIGGGYEWHAGKIINLRVEPYIQIPIRAIGMGSVRVVSTGIYLGFIIPSFK